MMLHVHVNDDMCQFWQGMASGVAGLSGVNAVHLATVHEIDRESAMSRSEWVWPAKVVGNVLL